MPDLPPIADASPDRALARMADDYGAASGAPLSAGDAEHLVLSAVATEMSRLRGRLNAAVDRHEAQREATLATLDAASPAGTAAAYRRHALLAHPDIALVGVASPEPGLVRVVVAGADGAALPGATLDTVRAHLESDAVRPICDSVLVERPDTVRVALTLRWWGFRPAPADPADVAAAVAGYRLWQGAALGRDVVASRLASSAQQVPGVHRATVGGPTISRVPDDELAVVTVATSYMGDEA